MPEEFDDEPQEKQEEYKGPITMEVSFVFRNERRTELICKYQKVEDAQRTISILNQAKQHSVPSNTVMLDDADGNVHLIDMNEVQLTTIRVRNK